MQRNQVRPIGDRWIIPHVPKCGGSSLRYMIEASIGGRLFRDYGEVAPYRDDDLTPKTECIIGHIRASKYGYLIEQGWNVGFFVRDPLDRMESEYNFIKQIDSENAPWLASIGGMPKDLAEFCLRPRERNRISSYLNMPIERCAFVGLFEEMSAGFKLFNKISGGLLGKYKDTHINAFPHKEKLEDIPKFTMGMIRKIHRQDIELYKKCEERWNSLQS